MTTSKSRHRPKNLPAAGNILHERSRGRAELQPSLHPGCMAIHTCRGTRLNESRSGSDKGKEGKNSLHHGEVVCAFEKVTLGSIPVQFLPR